MTIACGHKCILLQEVQTTMYSSTSAQKLAHKTEIVFPLNPSEGFPSKPIREHTLLLTLYCCILRSGEASSPQSAFQTHFCNLCTNCLVVTPVAQIACLNARWLVSVGSLNTVRLATLTPSLQLAFQWQSTAVRPGDVCANVDGAAPGPLFKQDDQLSLS